MSVYILTAKDMKRTAEIINMIILFWDWLCLQMSWNNIYEAQILGRIGGRYNLFCYNMISVCIRYFLLSKTFIKKYFFLSYKSNYSIGKWVFRLHNSRFKIINMFFDMNFNYFNYRFRVKYWSLKTNNTKTKYHKANSNT